MGSNLTAKRGTPSAAGTVGSPRSALSYKGVSAGAKIPIMPVEKSPPPYVVNRSSLRTEEVPRLVKGERRGRDQRTATARDEHPSDQPVDRLGSQNHSQVPARTWWSAGVWAAPGTGQQA